MEPFKYHVYVCTQQKPPGVPGCTASGSESVLEALRKEVSSAGLDDTVQVTTCGSLGLCGRGPNLVVYPEGAWYSKVQIGDIPELVREHFVNGRPLERLLNKDAAALKSEIQENRQRYLAFLKAQAEAGKQDKS
ncbi:MAG: (2Fe-2S) ferredoxin domain-containing protein [Acidobacteriota bacterium]|jgi:(2Fe-2S) ferredoxin